MAVVVGCRHDSERTSAVMREVGIGSATQMMKVAASTPELQWLVGR